MKHQGSGEREEGQLRENFGVSLEMMIFTKKILPSDWKVKIILLHLAFLFPHLAK